MVLEGMVLLALSALGAIKSLCAFRWWYGKESGFFTLWKEKKLYWQMIVWLAVYGGVWLLSGREMTAVRLFDLFVSYGILAIVDGKQRMVPDSILCCFFAGQMLLGAVTMPVQELGQVFASGFVFALAAMVFALLSGERIGMGDARLLGVTAMTAGWGYVLQVLCIGMVLSFVYSLFLLIFCRKNVKTEFPFVPFLAGGIVVHFLTTVFG